MRPAAFVVEIELGVARQPDHRRFEHGLPGEQLRQVRPDDVLEQDERVAVAVGDRHEARQSGRHLHDRQPAARLARGRARDASARFRLSEASSGNGRDSSIAERRQRPAARSSGSSASSASGAIAEAGRRPRAGCLRSASLGSSSSRVSAYSA